jgi:hypothetical protein
VVGGGAAVLVAFALLAIRDPKDISAILGGTVLALAVSSSILALYLRNTRIEITDEILSVRNWAGVTRAIPVASVREVVSAGQYSSDPGVPHHELFVFADTGVRILRMRGQVWDELDIDAVSLALSAVPTRIDRVIRPREFSRLYPGSVAWYEKSPILLGFAIMIGIMTVSVLTALASISTG